MVGALDDELAANYAPEQQHGLALDAIFQPQVRFFLARTQESAVGCGGVALFADFAEIKRMYVRPQSRGQGVAEAIVARLTAEALEAGLLARAAGDRHAPDCRHPILSALRFYAMRGIRAICVDAAGGHFDKRVSGKAACRGSRVSLRHLSSAAAIKD